MAWFPPRRGRPGSGPDRDGPDRDGSNRDGSNRDGSNRDGAGGFGADRFEPERTEPKGDDDDELYRHALERVAGPAPDPYLALRMIEPRLTGRRRPRALWVLGAAAIAVALALAGTRGSDRGVGVRVVSPDDSTPSTRSITVSSLPTPTTDGDADPGGNGGSSSTAGTPVATVESSSVPAESAPTDDPGETGSTTPDGTEADRSGDPTRPAPAPRPPPSRPTGATTSVDPRGVPDPGGTSPGPSPVPSAPVRSTTTVTGAVDYPCAGGKVTVTFDGRAMHLVAVSPAKGFAYEVDKVESDRIDVRFTGSSRDVQLRLSIDGGAVVAETNPG